jgi:predicted DNA-binding protein
MIRKDKIVSFRIESVLDEKVNRLAERNGISRADQYREMVKYYIVLKDILTNK